MCCIKATALRASLLLVTAFCLPGFIIKSLIALNLWWLPVTALNFYSLSFCFIMEMLFITFAIGDRVRMLKREKDTAQHCA
jgi:hypothetical protein